MAQLETDLRYTPDSERDLLNEALFLGENSATADRQALARAQELSRQGVDMETIRQQTGWFVHDGQWSYEISDIPFQQRGETAMPAGRREGRFFDYFSHPEALRAYPELQEMGVSARTPPFNYGQYQIDERTGAPIINLADRDQRRHLNVPLHELQHAIDDIEGRLALRPPVTSREELLRDPNEQRAYATEQRQALTPEERRRLPPTFEGLLGRGRQPPALQYVPDRP